MNRRNNNREEWVNDIALGLKQEFNLEHNEAIKRAASLMDKIGETRKAGEYYWPAPSHASRDNAIAKEFNGRNIAELKRRFGVSRRTIYNITSKAQEGHSAINQPKKSLKPNGK